MPRRIADDEQRRAATQVPPALRVRATVIPLLLLPAILGSVAAANQELPRERTYETRRIEGSPLVLDGRFDEPAWSLVPWSGDFIQHSPYEGKAPSLPTEFKILYGDDALYVAFRAWDPEPDKIERQLARRDWFPGDWVEINIDSRGDRRTAFSFTTSVSGVRGDEYVSEDGRVWDTSWDPVWQAATQVDADGWTAEIRIPFSQLRYGDGEEQVWGIQLTRRIFRHEERSTWQFVPQDAPGWVSLFGELRGIRGIRAPRRIELLPYGVATVERAKKVPGDPFRSGSEETIDVGLDGKLGLTGNLVVDFTVNPDFGQVEADPSEVNLTEFETFFEERRPFFIEGSEVFRYRLSEAVTGGSFTSDRLFYSRRIGRSPYGEPDLEEGESADAPTATSILGAAKLTGKSAGGLSIGVLDALTSREEAEIRGGASPRAQTVEPLTNHLVGRVQQEYGEGRTLLGGMLTATQRDIADPEVEFLPRSAYAGGLAFGHPWRGRVNNLQHRGEASHQRGGEEAMRRAQQAPARYYQRPDADYVEVDTARTSLSGHSGSLLVGKGTGRWRFQTGAAWRSPGFEINDLGYMRSADEINQSTWGGFYLNQPFSVFHELSVNANQWLSWDFGGRRTLHQYNVNTSDTFRNRWTFYAGATRGLEHRSNTLLRGGPAFLAPGYWEASANGSTDTRKPWSIEFARSGEWGDDGISRETSTSGGIRWRAASWVTIRMNPGHTISRSTLQFVEQCDFAGSDRFVVARLRQETAMATLRIDGCVTPNLTIQYYGQPFISSGRYDAFKRITDPVADRFRDRYHVFTTDGAIPEIHRDAASGTYFVDEDQNGTDDYSFQDPSFQYRAFLSNLVVRWEYHPGSTLFLVWSQGREGVTRNGDLSLNRDLEELFQISPRDIFLVKVSRWFSW